MLVKIGYIDGAVENYEAHTPGFREVDCCSFWIDEAGAHLAVGNLKKCKAEESMTGVPKRDTLIATHDEMMNDIAFITVDGDTRWSDTPSYKDPEMRRAIREGDRQFMKAYVANQKEAKKSFESLRNIDSVDDLLGE